MSTRCSTPVFSTCAFSPRPCSLQSPSRQWRAVTSRRRFVLRQHQPTGDFPFTVAGWHGDECSRCRGSLEQVGKIMLQLLLPFVLGHLSRPWIGNWVSRNKNGLRKLTRRPFCWWFILRSAKPSLTASGIKLAGDHCYLSWWLAAFFWLS